VSWRGRTMRIIFANERLQRGRQGKGLTPRPNRSPLPPRENLGKISAADNPKAGDTLSGAARSQDADLSVHPCDESVACYRSGLRLSADTIRDFVHDLFRTFRDIHGDSIQWFFQGLKLAFEQMRVEEMTGAM